MEKILHTDYRLLFQNGPIPMWIIDAQTMAFLEVNEAAVRTYGYSKSEFDRMTILDIRPAEEVAPTLAAFRKKKISDELFDAGCCRHMKKDGTVFYVHIYSHSTTYNDRPARLCFALDVDDRIKVEMENERLLAQMVNQTQDMNELLSSLEEAIWTRTAFSHRLIYGNRAYYEIYSLDKDNNDPDFDHFFASVYPPDKHIVTDAIESIYREGKVELIYRQIIGDGRIRTYKVQARLKCSADGLPELVMGVSTDITQEKELFDAIRNSEQKLLAVINNTTDLIWSVDTSLKLTSCNTAFQDFFLRRAGVALDVGDNILGPWNPEAFIAKRTQDYQRVLAGDSFTTIIEEHFKGSVQYFEIRSNPIIDCDGRIIGVNCVSRDISHERQQLISIREQNEKLRELARAKVKEVKDALQAIADSRQVDSPDVQLSKALAGIADISGALRDISDKIDGIFPDSSDIIARL